MRFVGIALVYAVGCHSLVAAMSSWTGEVIRTIADDFGATLIRSELTVQTTGGDLLDLDSNGRSLVSAATTGCGPLQLAGVRKGNALRYVSVLPKVSISPSCKPSGEQRTAVLLFNYPNSQLRADFTKQNVSQLVLGPGTSLAGYLAEASFGKMTMVGDVFGPFVVDSPLLPGACGPPLLTQFRDAALKAIGGAVELRSYNRIILITPHGPDCGGVLSAGQAIPDCPTFTLPDGSVSTAGVAWASLDKSRDYHEILPTIIHEVGHTLGITDHASSLDFGNAALGKLADPGVHDEYGDRYTTMGGYKCAVDQCTHGHFSAEHKLLLGWLDSGDIQEVSSSGTFNLRPYEDDSGVRALKILRPGTAQALWIEYRQQVGYDSTLYLLNPRAFEGVLIHYDPAIGYEGSPYTHLVDFHPTKTPNDFANAPLLTGETWTDPYTPLSISVGAPTPVGIPVRVSFADTCAAVSPGNAVLNWAANQVTFQVQGGPGCHWAASSQMAWADVLPPSAGTGSATVPVNVLKNDGALTRTGWISIGRNLIAITQQPAVQLLYSNFGPSDSYESNRGIGFGGLGQVAGFSLAAPFRPSVSAPVSRVELVVGVDGRSTDQPAFNVSILADASGRPGDPIETIAATPNLKNSFTGANNNTPQFITVDSITHPTLSAGIQYWLALSPVNLTNSGNLLMYWSLNNTGATAPIFAARVGAGGWGTTGTDLTVFRITGTGAPRGYVSGVVNAASFRAGAVAPGEIITVFGDGLGPAQLEIAKPIGASFSSDPLHGTSVLFDGIPAPLLYVSNGQIGAIVPYATEKRTAAQIQIVQNGVSSAPFVMPIAQTAPGLFAADSSGSGLAAALNQDGTLNSLANPAALDSIVVVFMTGAGQTDPSGADGLIATTIFPKPRLASSVTIDGQSAEVLYAGAAPDAVAGLVQINFRIPSGVRRHRNAPVLISIGQSQSQPGLLIAIE